MRRNRPALFKGRHLEAEVSVFCVRWYLPFGRAFDIALLHRQTIVPPQYKVVLRAPWRPSSYNAPSGSRRSRTADSGDGGFLVTIKGDRMSNAEFKQFLEATFRSYRSIVKPGASMYLCHSSSWQREFQNALESADFEVRCQIIWAKNTFAWVSVVTSSSTSRCSTVTSQARRTPGTATRPSRRCGARKSLRRTASTQPPNQQS